MKYCKNHTSSQSFSAENAYIHLSFVCVSSKSAPSVKKQRRLVVFIGLIPTGITFEGYIIISFGAWLGTLHNKVDTNRMGPFSCENNEKYMCFSGTTGDSCALCWPHIYIIYIYIYKKSKQDLEFT